MKIEALIAEARLLPAVPVTAISEYYKQMAACVSYVDALFANRTDISKLIGHNPLSLVYDNHRHHATFMVTVFSVGNYELLARTLPWVYRAYGAHGFSHDYFLIELNGWVAALKKHTDFAMMGTVVEVYQWMIRRHQDIIHLSSQQAESSPLVDEEWLPRKNGFLTAVLHGDHHACLAIVREAASDGCSTADIYQQIIQPVMYEIGILWENNTISVAQEHLASAIVGRVLAAVSMNGPLAASRAGKVVVTAASSEYHEIGAWMISDVLEQEGWDVRYLGANTPPADLLALLRDFRPDALVISVTMPFNILQARETIRMIREDGDLGSVRVMVGGQAFRGTPDLWKDTGADGYGANVNEAVSALAGWRDRG